jgi:hypothetical protein
MAGTMSEGPGCGVDDLSTLLPSIADIMMASDVSGGSVLLREFRVRANYRHGE